MVTYKSGRNKKHSLFLSVLFVNCRRDDVAELCSYPNANFVMFPNLDKQRDFLAEKI